MDPGSLPMHSAHLWLIAHQARLRCASVPEDGNALADDALVAIVFAAFAMESFINEIAELLRRLTLPAPEHSLAGLAVPGVYGDVAGQLAHLGARASTVDKLATALEAAGWKHARGQEPLQSAQLLMALRDWVAHFGPRKETSSVDVPAKFRVLEAEGLLREWESPNVALIDRLLSRPIAKWACDVVVDVMRTTLAALPDRSVDDGVHSFRERVEWLATLG